MRNQVFVPSGAVTLVAMLMLAGTPGALKAQAPSRAQVEEAARKASPHSSDDAMEYWKAEIDKRLAEATARVYDPARPPMANAPKTPWDAPDIRGYFLTAMYTPLQRP